ncbi:MAG TPA: 50S ribosomal protein L25 [Acidimicrobiales bacterium]|nr:50S ribosomal protein L25 [Acidimicrobiales bacterium]
MPDIVLVAETKRPLGTRASRRLRHHGRVPAVVYGHGVEAVPVSVDARALRAALSTSAGRNAVFELDVEGTHHLAMAKVVDHHPVRHTIAHVDFLVIDRNETVTAEVRIALSGEAELVARDGGAIEQVLHSLTVTMLPGAIPDAITVDISALAPGGTIRIGDLALPSGVTTNLDPDTAVVSATQAAAVEAPAEEGEAPAEDGAPAEGGA